MAREKIKIKDEVIIILYGKDGKIKKKGGTKKPRWKFWKRR